MHRAQQVSRAANVLEAETPGEEGLSERGGSGGGLEDRDRDRDRENEQRRATDPWRKWASRWEAWAGGWQARNDL